MKGAMTSAASQVPTRLDHAISLMTHEATDDGQAWLVRLMRDSGPGIVRMLWRLLGHEQDVMDCYQECICRLASLDRPRKVRDVKSYAYRAASNIAIELIRRHKRQAEHWPRVVDFATRQSPSDSPDSVGGAERIRALREAILMLPDHLRQVIVLRDLGELPYAKVAKMLSVGVATARVYRRQAIVRLATLVVPEAERERDDAGSTSPSVGDKSK
jgi:RNA polymerase sigma-70 factor, ECF subfamily